MFSENRSDHKSIKVANGKSFLKDLEIKYTEAKEKMLKLYDEEKELAFFNILSYFEPDTFDSFKSESLKIITIVNKFSNFDEFRSYWDNFSDSKLNMAKKINKTYIKKILGFIPKIKIQEDFESKYLLIEKLRKFNLCSKFMTEDFESFSKINNRDILEFYFEYLVLDDTYKNWFLQRNINNITENEVIKIIKEYVNNIGKYIATKRNSDSDFRKIYKSYNGRIERGSTQPQLFIQTFKDFLKEVYKVIVGTPEQLANFINFEKDHYDYIIFDEASQMFFEKAIPFVSVGTKIIVAGDNQQMRPSNWFSKRWDDEDEAEDSSEYDSLLEWAHQELLPVFNLEMNYRSMSSELVLFSSKEFYKSNLKTIDNNIENKAPAIDVIECFGVWEEQRNNKEADKMVELAETYYDPEKKETLILLTFNSKQQNLVINKILDNNPKLYTGISNGQIKLKNIENIQGDEADIVIASVCYDKNTRLSATYIGTKQGRNALNVAITRAKKQLIVLKSIKSDEVRMSNDNNVSLKTFKNWLEYLEKNSAERKKYAPVEVKDNNELDSSFEEDVTNWLKNQKFKNPILIENQFSIGSYRIDIALLDYYTGKFLIGIEVDGYQYHSGVKKLFQDRKRQDFLIAKGYPIYRVSETDWKYYRDVIKKDLEIILE